MAEQSHTAGEWRVKGMNGNLVYADAGFIAEVHGDTRGSSSQTAKANARLIATAPDYHAAACEFVAGYANIADEDLQDGSSQSRAILAFRAAIARATSSPSHGSGETKENTNAL